MAQEDRSVTSLFEDEIFWGSEPNKNKNYFDYYRANRSAKRDVSSQSASDVGSNNLPTTQSVDQWNDISMITDPPELATHAHEPTASAVIATLAAPPEKLPQSPGKQKITPNHTAVNANVPPMIFLNGGVVGNAGNPDANYDGNRGKLWMLRLAIVSFILAILIGIGVALLVTLGESDGNSKGGDGASTPQNPLSSTTAPSMRATSAPVLSPSDQAPQMPTRMPILSPTPSPSVQPTPNVFQPTPVPVQNTPRPTPSPTPTPTRNPVQPTPLPVQVTPRPSPTPSPTPYPTIVEPTRNPVQPTPLPVQVTPRPTPSPTPYPTVAEPTPNPIQPTLSPMATSAPAEPTLPNPILEELSSLFRSISFDNGAALSNTSSPQYQALEWLAADSGVETYPRWKKVQRYVLATLYFGTGGENWNSKHGWLTEIDECDWYKATRDMDSSCNSKGLIDNLDLRNNNLRGLLAPEIAHLSDNLEYLFLSENALSGKIPTTMGMLTKLRRFKATSNDLTGTLPSQLGAMSRLENLGVGRNQLAGKLPPELSRLQNLGGLGLERNWFTGTIPTDYAQLTNINRVALDRNLLEGMVPEEISQWTSLIRLALDGNNLSGRIPPILCTLAESILVDCEEVSCSCCEGCSSIITSAPP